MERQIGEIFEYNGEWYQCVEYDSCGECSLRTTECGNGTKSDLAVEVFGNCSKLRRSENKHAIFKKLEKVGEPYLYKGILMQPYRRATKALICDWNPDYLLLEHGDSDIIDIEIKQNKENMEENKLNLKPFDIQKAREGKPVCTRDGRKARIICFDRKCIYEGQDYSIVALINEGPYRESVYSYTKDGLYNPCKIDNNDLMMLSEKKEGWINVYRLNTCYKTKEEAEANIDRDYEDEYVRTVKINWEE